MREKGIKVERRAGMRIKVDGETEKFKMRRDEGIWGKNERRDVMRIKIDGDWGMEVGER